MFIIAALCIVYVYLWMAWIGHVGDKFDNPEYPKESNHKTLKVGGLILGFMFGVFSLAVGYFIYLIF